MCWIHCSYPDFVINLDDGARWSNIFEPISSTNMLCLGFLIIILIVDIVLYMLLAIYFDNIFPSEFGLRKPPYYPFLVRNYSFHIHQWNYEILCKILAFKLVLLQRRQEATARGYNANNRHECQKRIWARPWKFANWNWYSETIETVWSKKCCEWSLIEDIWWTNYSSSR